MERIYHCPICGKTYTSLTEMYNCARSCEAKEIANESKLETERKEAEKAILNQYEKLKTDIHNYNLKYSPNSFDIFMKHQGQTLASNDTLEKMKNVKPALNYNKKANKENVSLEDFLRNEISRSS